MLFVSFHVRIESSFGEQMTIRNANSRWTQKQCTVKRLKSSKPQISSLIWHTFNIQAIVRSSSTHIHTAREGNWKERNQETKSLLFIAHSCENIGAQCIKYQRSRILLCLFWFFYVLSAVSHLHMIALRDQNEDVRFGLVCFVFHFKKKLRMHFRYVLIYIELRKPVELF